MTFRLVNAGKKEVWHQEEFIYHTWHPGTDGMGNYLGPHDGRNVSTTALKARITGRVMPLVENPAIRMLIKQFHMKVTKFSSKPKSLKDVLRKVSRAYGFLKNMSQHNANVFEKCKKCIEELASNNIYEIALYGTGDVAKVFYQVTLNSPLRIRAVYDTLDGKKFFNLDVIPIEEIKNQNGKIVVTALVGVEDKVEMLKK